MRSAQLIQSSDRIEDDALYDGISPAALAAVASESTSDISRTTRDASVWQGYEEEDDDYEGYTDDEDDDDYEAYDGATAANSGANAVQTDVGLLAPSFYGTPYARPIGTRGQSLPQADAKQIKRRRRRRRETEQASFCVRSARWIRRSCIWARRQMCTPRYEVPKKVLVCYHLIMVLYAIFLGLMGMIGFIYALKLGLSWRELALVDTDHVIASSQLSTDSTTDRARYTSFTRIQLATLSLTLALSGFLLFVSFTAIPYKVALLFACGQRTVGRIGLLLFISMQCVAFRSVASVYSIAMVNVLPRVVASGLLALVRFLEDSFHAPNSFNVLYVAGMTSLALIIVTVLLGLPCWYTTNPYSFSYAQLRSALWSYDLDDELFMQQHPSQYGEPSDFPPPPEVPKPLLGLPSTPTLGSQLNEKVPLLSHPLPSETGSQLDTHTNYSTFAPAAQAALLAGCPPASQPQTSTATSQKSSQKSSHQRVAASESVVHVSDTAGLSQEVKSTLSSSSGAAGQVGGTSTYAAPEQQQDFVEIALELPPPGLAESLSLLLTPSPARPENAASLQIAAQSPVHDSTPPVHALKLGPVTPAPVSSPDQSEDVEAVTPEEYTG